MCARLSRTASTPGHPCSPGRLEQRGKARTVRVAVGRESFDRAEQVRAEWNAESEPASVTTGEIISVVQQSVGLALVYERGLFRTHIRV
jgi:hypothetical protein